MPDLVTHSTVAWLLARRWRRAGPLVLVLLGAQLPDLLTRVPGIFLDKASLRWFDPLHSPVGVLLVSLLVAQLFRVDLRRQAFACFFFGGATHLLLDAFQFNLCGSYHWLFPWSTWNGQIGILPIEAAVATIPLQLLAVWLLWIGRRR